MELYIARHGQTEYNVAGRIQGSGLDSPLTAVGAEQAKTLGEAIKDMNFDAVYSSPLKRAMDTTRIIFNDEELFEKGAQTDSRLVEIGMGEAEGLLWEEAKKGLIPDPFDPEYYLPPPGGEELQDMITRIDSFLQELATKPYKRVFVLTHGYTLRVVHACALDKSVTAIRKAPWFDNCALFKYVHDGYKWNLAD